MTEAFTVEQRGWTFLGRRYVIVCPGGVETHVSADKGAAEKFAASLNQAYRIGFLDGRGYALKEADAMVRNSLSKIAGG